MGVAYTPFSSSRLFRFWISRMVFMLMADVVELIYDLNDSEDLVSSPCR